MSSGAPNNEPPGDEATNTQYPSSFNSAMNPYPTGSATPTPNTGFNTSFNADMSAPNGARQASSSSTPAGREGSYVPQFSAATEMILRRMRGEPTGEFDPASSPNVDGWEEAKAKVMMGMKTTMNMDMGPMPQQGRRGSAQRQQVSRTAASRAASFSRNASSTPVPSAPSAVPASAVSTPVPTGNAAKGGARSTPNSATRGSARGRGSSAKGGARGGGRGGRKRKRPVEEEFSEESAEESDNMSKLGDDSSASDGDGDGDSVTNMPSMTSSGRQIQKPKNFVPNAVEGPPRKKPAQKKSQDQALCKRCGRGHSPQSNMIVFCDGCNMGWHQMCHDPMVSDEVVKDESSEWYCAECTAKREKKTKKMSGKTEPVQKPGGGEQVAAAAAQGQQTFNDQQQQRMYSSGSGGIDGSAGKTMEEKRSYLSVLPHSQLVALLLQASTLHPDLDNQIFSTGSGQPPMRSGFIQPHALQQPYGGGSPYHTDSSSRPQTGQGRTHIHVQRPFPPSAASGLFSRAEANPTAPINFIRKIPSTGIGMDAGNGMMSSSPYGGPQQQQQQDANFFNAFGQQGNLVRTNTNGNNDIFRSSNNNNIAVNPSLLSNAAPREGEEGEEGESSRESTPASPPYPRPGNGLMRKLAPDDQDLEWLEDRGDYEAFSHVVYDGQGRGERIEEDGVPVAGIRVVGVNVLGV